MFSAGSVTSERERQTLDLLLTTILSPWQILWGKLLSGLRVSSVLTMFLLWPLLLAVRHGPRPTGRTCRRCWATWRSCCSTCLTTATLALFCSVMFRKTSISLMTTYCDHHALVLRAAGAANFVEAFFSGQAAQHVVQQLGFVSPISVCFNLPLSVDRDGADPIVGNWWLLASFVGFYGAMNALLIGVMSCILHTRWRVMYLSCWMNVGHVSYVPVFLI